MSLKITNVNGKRFHEKYLKFKFCDTIPKLNKFFPVFFSEKVS